MSSTNEYVDRYFAALNQMDRDAYVACFTTEATVQDPYGARPLQGAAGLNKFMDGMERTWQSFEMTPTAHYAAGDRVAAPWTCQATAKSGKQAQFSGVNVFTLGEDGRITQLEGYWDFKGMIAQIQ